MRHNLVESPDTIKSRPSAGSEIDYSPRTYTVSEQIVFGAKLTAVVGIFFLILWLVEKHLAP